MTDSERDRERKRENVRKNNTEGKRKIINEKEIEVEK